jgi:hypothetical protein
MNFPGSLTLRPETFYAFLHDVIEGLSRHGLKKFLLVNGHGGNAATLGMSLVRLKRELDVPAAHIYRHLTGTDRDPVGRRVPAAPARLDPNSLLAFGRPLNHPSLTASYSGLRSANAATVVWVPNPRPQNT